MPRLIRPRSFADLKGVKAAFTTRKGGVSPPPYNELNLGRSTGDASEAVDHNRAAVLKALGFENGSMALGGQIHSATVAVVDAPVDLNGNDGLVTTEKGVALAILAADCAAVLLADEKAQVAGACHAGWRGAVGGICEATIVSMVQEGADISRIRAFISPCISQPHFEVGGEVAERFEAQFVRYEALTGRPHVDLRGSIAHSLQLQGIHADNIEISPHCTFADHELFYSYRRDGMTSGRMMGIIGLT